MTKRYSVPDEQAISREISKFIYFGKKAYLDKIGKKHEGRSYFIVADNHYVDMKAIWFGASDPKTETRAGSKEIKPALEKLGFEIFYGTPAEAKIVEAIESHKRAERSYWSRNPKLAKTRKEMSKYHCEACDLFFPEMYDGLGDKFLEVHHLTPFSKADKNKIVVVTIDDVVALCANCHHMIHELGRRSGSNPTLKSFKSKIASRV